MIQGLVHDFAHVAQPKNSALLAATLARHLRAQLIETHISWLVLAKDIVYKIKKPVRLDFVDYSTLEARRHFCEEELRLNRRLAPSLYLGITPITGSPEAPVLEGVSPVLEYAVRMRRFPPGALFSEQLAAGTLQPKDVDSLARLLAGFHANAPVAPLSSSYGSTDWRAAAALRALEGIGPLATDIQKTLLRDWIQGEARALAPLWEQRRAQGSIRECHGDLHLANVVSLETGVAAFDGIEFDPALRWIDVLDDVAFVVMDFSAWNRTDYAFRLLNTWLDLIGEHEALPALRFAVVYRALVRAQVAVLRGSRGDARRYLETALSWLRPCATSRLVITYGLPGSGKSFQSQRLLERDGAIRLRSDVERKRLYGLGMLDNSRNTGLDLYHPKVTERTYARLLALARIAVCAGYPVVIDAAFLKADERARARALAQELGVPFGVLACEAPMHVLRQRLLDRKDDASEADVTVLERLIPAVEPLAPAERDLTL